MAENKKAHTTEDSKSTGHFGNIVQIIMVSAIVIVIGIVVILLLRWQRGTDLVITEDDLTEDYSIESEDFYFPFNPSTIEGYVDDGVLNVVVLGDQSVANPEDPTSISSLIAQKTGAQVTTLALPESTISLQVPSFTLETAEDAYSFYYLATSMAGGKRGGYELQLSALDYIENPEPYMTFLEDLRAIAFDEVDILILSYGLNDYLQGQPMTGNEIYIDQPYGTMDSLCGALDSGLASLHERYPYMQIILSSPTYCRVPSSDGEQIGADMYSYGNGTLGDYVANCKSVAQLQQTSFVDNYFISEFNGENYEGYLEEDGMPGAKAREFVADHIITFFYTNRQAN